MTTQQDAFSKWRPENLTSAEIPQKNMGDVSMQSQQSPQENVKEDPFGKWRAPNLKELYEGDDIDRLVERNIAGLASRGVEQIAGFPGNVREFAKSMKELYHNDPLQKKIKSIIKQPEGMKKFEEEILPITQTVGSIIDWFPTSSELRDKSKELTKGFTEPTDEYSKIGHEVFEDVISSVLPGSGPRNVYRNVAIPVLSVLAKEGSKYIGIGDKGQTATKFGVNFLLNMMNRTNAPKLNRDMWKDVENTAPNINISPSQNTDLLSKAQNLENQLMLGLGSTSENSALKTVRSFIEKLTRQGTTISAKELAASNRSLNEITKDPALLEGGRKVLNGLKKTINDGIEHVSTQDPQWVQKWRDANETHGAIQNSNFVANFISERYGKPIVNEGTRALFGLGPKTAVGVAVASAPLFGIYKGVQVLKRMSNSPILQTYYKNAILASLKGNTATMTSNLEKLDKELEKKSKKIPYK